MKIRAVLAAGVAGLVLLVSGCSDDGGDASAGVASTTSIEATTYEAPLPGPTTSCQATPGGTLGLTSVEVTNGGHNITWHTNAPIPDSGVVAFTLTAGTLVRGLKYSDGRVIANYLFHMSTATQDDVSNPPTVTDGGRSYRVVVPPLYVTDLEDAGSWTADLEVMSDSTGMESTGKCTSS
ncbi:MULTISPECIES: hypothetical protein [Gordonia]|uniref:hypothetical protein n=1 Tax=Gordonia TaxID=2053 RepID=UPI0022DF7DAF|nr:MULTISPECIES: hypothetical protein [Gordonia]